MEVKKLLADLQYCNDYIKCCNTKDYKKIISNTKFYDLKNCIMVYLLRYGRSLGIEFGSCVMQPQGDKTLVLIPIIYNGEVYEFHQIYEDIEWALIESNAEVQYSPTEYSRPTKTVDIDIEKFDKRITRLKHYVWNHYKRTLADPYIYVDQPMKFMRMVELVNKRLKFEIFTNGGLMKYHITARLKYKDEIVVQKPLQKIRKNIFQYIAMKNKQ